MQSALGVAQKLKSTVTLKIHLRLFFFKEPSFEGNKISQNFLAPNNLNHWFAPAGLHQQSNVQASANQRSSIFELGKNSPLISTN